MLYHRYLLKTEGESELDKIVLALEVLRLRDYFSRSTVEKAEEVIYNYLDSKEEK